jgi:hypothetical protein
MLESRVVQLSTQGWSRNVGLGLARLRLAWHRSKIYVLLASGYAIERLAMIAEATHLIEREKLSDC